MASHLAALVASASKDPKQAVFTRKSTQRLFQHGLPRRKRSKKRIAKNEASATSSPSIANAKTKIRIRIRTETRAKNSAPVTVVTIETVKTTVALAQRLASTPTWAVYASNPRHEMSVIATETEIVSAVGASTMLSSDYMVGSQEASSN